MEGKTLSIVFWFFDLSFKARDHKCTIRFLFLCFSFALSPLVPLNDYASVLCRSFNHAIIQGYCWALFNKGDYVTKRKEQGKKPQGTATAQLSLSLSFLLRPFASFYLSLYFSASSFVQNRSNSSCAPSLLFRCVSAACLNAVAVGTWLGLPWWSGKRP